MCESYGGGRSLVGGLEMFGGEMILGKAEGGANRLLRLQGK